MRNKVILLMSGGYDSTVCLSLLHSLGYEGICLFFDYGQPSVEIERERAKANTSKYGGGKFVFKEITIRTDWLSNPEIDGYYPSRNVILFSYALSLAEKEEMDKIVFGIFYVPYPYSDCTLEFVNNCKSLASAVGIDVDCPLYNIGGKNEVYILGRTLGVDFNDTWSCDAPKEDGSPCGICGACFEMRQGKAKGLI